jgi:hypothetical protein
MSDTDRPESVPTDSGAEKAAKVPKDPADTLNMALLVYLAVNVLFGVPLLLFPRAYYDFVGADAVADELGALRWVGAALLAWATGAVLVLARPGGRAIFVTVGALQLTFAAVAMGYSWAASERLGSTFWHGASVVIFGLAAAVMWWARFRARRVLSAPTSGG